MKRIVIVMMALLVAEGCATTSSPRSSERLPVPLAARLPPEAVPPDVRAAYAEANQTLMSTQRLFSIEAISAAEASALNAYNRVLARQPDFMDALNDKAWILATTPDPALRNPREALNTAHQALDSLARAGMLRENREAFGEEHTTGRMIVAATTYAAALAANGTFSTGETQLAANCVATADTVMDFVVESAVNLDQRFRTPSTAEMARRAREYQASFRQRKPIIGAPPLFSLLSPATRLR